MAKDPKPTERMLLDDVMKQMAEALDGWALAREKVLDKLDLKAAAEARELAAEIRGCLEKVAHAGSPALTEEATKRLQLLRSNSLEFLARSNKA